MKPFNSMCYTHVTVDFSQKASSPQPVVLLEKHLNKALSESGFLPPASTPEHISHHGDFSLLDNTLRLTNFHKRRLENQLKKEVEKLRALYRKKYLAKTFALGYLADNLAYQYEDQFQRVQKLKRDIKKRSINLHVELPDKLKLAHVKLLESFHKLLQTDKAWHLSPVLGQQFHRQELNLTYDKTRLIQGSSKAIILNAGKGRSLQIFPGFALHVNQDHLQIWDFKLLNITCSIQNWTETGPQPFDAKVIGTTWEKTNAKGARDQSFNINNMVPICEYAKVDIGNENGYTESFLFSNFVAAQDFVDAFQASKNSILQHQELVNQSNPAVTH